MAICLHVRDSMVPCARHLCASAHSEEIFILCAIPCWPGALRPPSRLVGLAEARGSLPICRKGGSMSLSVDPLSPQVNRLLAALPPADYERLLPQLAPITWALGDVLYEPGRAMAYLYFPTTAIVSLVYTMVDGTTAEMGMVGNEGV